MATIVQIPRFRRPLFDLFRIIFSMSIISDAVWYAQTFEVRRAHFTQAGLPQQLIYLVAGLHTLFGVRLLFGHKLESSCVVMMTMYATIVFFLHHASGTGGIGDYPHMVHGDVNFSNALVYLAVVGTLLAVFASIDLKRRGKIMEGTKSYAIVLAKATLTIYFVAENLYFKLYERQVRSKQSELTGGSAWLEVDLLACVYMLSVGLCWSSRPMLRQLGAITLFAATGLTTWCGKGSGLGSVLGTGYMKAADKLHFYNTQAAVASGCMLLFSTAGMTPQPYATDDDEDDDDDISSRKKKI